jgi:hypothetical protein
MYDPSSPANGFFQRLGCLVADKISTFLARFLLHPRPKTKPPRYTPPELPATEVRMMTHSSSRYHHKQRKKQKVKKKTKNNNHTL